MTTLFRYGLLTALMFVWVTGCQTYQRRPLEIRGYADAWVTQSFDVESVRQYAQILAENAEPTDTHKPFDLSDGLTLHEAQAMALHFNPQLRLARLEAKVSRVVAEESGWWPDPTFELFVQRFTDRSKGSKFKFSGPSIDGVNAGGIETTPLGIRKTGGETVDDPWIVNAGLSFTIPLSGRLAVEEDLNWSLYSAAWRQILVQEWELLTKLTHAWFDWSSVTRRVEVIHDYLERIESIGETVVMLTEAGEMKPTESRVLRIELLRQRATLMKLQAQAHQKRLSLFSILGISSDATLTLEPVILVSAMELPTEDRKSQLLENHPYIKMVEANYEIAEQNLRMEIHKQYPDLQIGPKYSLEEGFLRLGGGFGIPLPLWNRNRQGIAEAFEQREAARARALAQVQRVLTELTSAENRMRFATLQREYILNNVIPQVDQQVQDSRTLLGLGEVNVLLLRDALTGLLETKLEVLQATLAEAQASFALQQMIQPRWFTPSGMENKED